MIPLISKKATDSGSRSQIYSLNICDEIHSSTSSKQRKYLFTNFYNQEISMKLRYWVFVCAFIATEATAGNSTLDAAIGGGLGGAAGAAIGNEVGGRDAAILGGALGAAVGTAISTDKETHHAPAPAVRYEEYEHHDEYEHHYREKPKYYHCPPGHHKKGEC